MTDRFVLRDGRLVPNSPGPTLPPPPDGAPKPGEVWKHKDAPLMLVRINRVYYHHMEGHWYVTTRGGTEFTSSPRIRAVPLYLPVSAFLERYVRAPGDNQG